MIEIIIPGYRSLHLQHLVMDYNGTLAQDGLLLDGVRSRLESLAEHLRLHVITADTFGMAGSQLNGLPCELVILPVEQQAQGKLAYVDSLGRDKVVAIGNGRNDRLMIASAALRDRRSTEGRRINRNHIGCRCSYVRHPLGAGYTPFPKTPGCHLR